MHTERYLIGDFPMKIQAAIPFEAISIIRCDPRCVRFEKTEKRDNQVEFSWRFAPCPLLQVFLSYDCETATVPDEEGTEVAAEGDTYLLR